MCDPANMDLSSWRISLLVTPSSTSIWAGEFLEYRAVKMAKQVREIVEIVRAQVGLSIEITVIPTSDYRHVSSRRIHNELGFTTRRTVENAIVDLRAAFAAGKVPNSMTDARYYNIKRMEGLNLQ